MTDQTVKCPNCGCQVFEHALKLSCYAHVPGDDADTRQKVQQQEREKEYGDDAIR